MLTFALGLTVGIALMYVYAQRIVIPEHRRSVAWAVAELYAQDRAVPSFTKEGFLHNTSGFILFAAGSPDKTAKWLAAGPDDLSVPDPRI